MYKPGDVKISWSKNDENDYVDCDARADEYTMPHTRWPLAYLAHSCDEWIIGNVACVDQMITDLQQVREQLVNGK